MRFGGPASRGALNGVTPTGGAIGLCLPGGRWLSSGFVFFGGSDVLMSWGVPAGASFSGSRLARIGPVLIERIGSRTGSGGNPEAVSGSGVVVPAAGTVACGRDVGVSTATLGASYPVRHTKSSWGLPAFVTMLPFASR